MKPQTPFQFYEIEVAGIPQEWLDTMERIMGVHRMQRDRLPINLPKPYGLLVLKAGGEVGAKKIDRCPECGKERGEGAA